MTITSESPVLTPTADPLDAFLDAIQAANGIGDVRLYRYSGSLRSALKTYGAGDFDPFNVAAEHGGGKYFAQFVQGGQIRRSASFVADGPPKPPPPLGNAQPSPATADPNRDTPILGLIMQQNTALIAALAQPKEDKLLSLILPMLLKNAVRPDTTPVEIYTRIMDMIERRMDGSGGEERNGLAQLIREYAPTILPIITKAAEAAPAAQAAQQPPRKPPTPHATATAAPEPEPEPTPSADSPDSLMQQAEQETGVPLTMILRTLRFAIAEAMQADSACEIIANRIDALGVIEAPQVWQRMTGTDPNAILPALLHLFPDLKPHAEYISAVFAGLIEEAEADQAPEPAATTVYVGNELRNRPAPIEPAPSPEKKRKSKKEANQ